MPEHHHLLFSLGARVDGGPTSYPRVITDVNEGGIHNDKFQYHI